jgi:hypothetical protein
VDLELVVMLLVGPFATALVAVVARLAAAGRIARNAFVGIRLPSTMASDAAWHAGHRAAVAPACWSLAVLLLADVAALLLRARGVSTDALTVALVVPLLLAIVWIVVASSRSASAAH